MSFVAVCPAGVLVHWEVTDTALTNSGDDVAVVVDDGDGDGVLAAAVAHEEDVRPSRHCRPHSLERLEAAP